MDEVKRSHRILELSRTKKGELAKIADRQMAARGTVIIFGAPHSEWSKDELISEIIRNEFPRI